MIKELFQKRLSAFCNSLSIHKQKLWGNSDVVVIHSQQEKNPNSLSSQFYLWFVGEELHDTTAIFTPYVIYFFCTQKDYFKIRSLCCAATLVRKIPVSVQLKAKNDDGFSLIDLMIRNARVIRNSKVFLDDDDRSCPFVVGYIEGEYPKSKLFWNCMNDLEPRKYKAATVNSGLKKLINTADNPNFGVGLSDEKEVLKSVEFLSPMHIFSPPIDAGKEKGLSKTKNNLKDKRESSLWSEHDKLEFLQFSEKGNQSPLLENEKINLESIFKRIDLSEKGMSNLDSKFDNTKLLFKDKGESGKLVNRLNENTLPTTSTNENVSQLMENLNLFSSSSSGKQDKLRIANIYDDHLFKLGNCLDGGKEDNSKAENKNSDQVFKFGAISLDGKEGKSKEVSKNGDQVFKFGASKLDGKDGKSKEGNANGDQLLQFGEGKKDGDQLFKLGEGKKDGDQQFKIGGKRGRNYQPQLIEENKGAKDVKLVMERLTAFYSSWRKYKEEQWGKADVLVITTQSVGPVETLSRPISSSFLVWLLDDEFPETTAVFTDAGIEFLCPKESFLRLRTIGIRMTVVAKVTVSVQLKKRGEQCVDWLKKTLCQVNTAPKSGANWCPLVVGCIIGESMEIEALSHSKMFEVAYVHNSLTNLLEQWNFEKPESFAAQQSTLPKQFQILSLETCGGAKTANAVSFSELAKIRSMDDNSYVLHTPGEEKSLLEKMGDTSSLLLTDNRVDNGGPVSKPEEIKVFGEDNSSRKLADKMMSLEIKEGDMETSITEDGAEEKLLAEEQNMLCNHENSPLLQVKECGEQSRPTAGGGMDYSVQPTGVTDAASENSLPDDNNGSSRKDSVGSDHEYDDWTLIEMDCEEQETEVAERVSWKRWFMDKTGKSFGLKDEVSDEAPSKRSKADP
ncbi:hypothetical protein HAX54_021562 [Datura stramonium]|uniref:FACT complex subunit n=1 Tax=Datura stramonium TaxID=4076 RepID=A0ABS8S3M5_DATST|nr:hypothetical protein [Datura stramonium]